MTDSQNSPTESNNETKELKDVVDFPDDQRTDDRRWIILYEEDYDDIMIDIEDNVGILVDIEQVGEILRLASMMLADLSHRDADPDEPLRDMIEQLEKEVSEA